SNNYLASIFFSKDQYGISFLDISTGEFLCAQGDRQYIDKLLQGFRPSEIIFQKSKQKEFINDFSDKYYTFTLDDWVFTLDFAYESLLKHFGTKSLKGFGIEDLQLPIISAGAILHYLGETQHPNIKHISSIARIEEEKYVWLDRFTVRNLELLSSPNEDGVPLIEILDKTISPMGARLMNKWMVLPLKEKQLIEERLNVVKYFVEGNDLVTQLTTNIKQIGDIERLISKVAVARVNPRELVHLKRALNAIGPIKDVCTRSSNKHLQKIAEQLNPCSSICEKIEKEILPDPSVFVEKGGVIADGVSSELDDLRKIASSGKEYLIQIQQREIKSTGITSLKVGFNNVFGYYIDVTHRHKDKVPKEWIRKQTLTNSERYITEELKEYEEKILGAEEKIQALETKLFTDIILSLADYIQPIQLNANLIARLDCLLSFATSAVKNNYVCPEINETYQIGIKDGRHPVIEQTLEIGEEYIPNDVFLDNDTQQIIIITGPNMAGKSALLRQTALIVLMAQIGSFVPASSAQIGIVDKIFTRVGASDNISSGESTFMVEMNETASILNNVSNRSLILLDEIGRGTSTYDGISIAWAITEYLHNHPTARPKVLFATHYHELNEMSNTLDRIKNYNVAVKEVNNKVIFLRKLKKGGSEHSFGIHVAKMSGIPQGVVDRANIVLEQLEQKRSGKSKVKSLRELPKQEFQMQMFQMDDPELLKIREEITNLDINTLTPIEALLKLSELKKALKK
ncbi:DNA mismatch repair protein MutS, partial [Bacteroidales bacterium AH-315-N07]|nr:DNA mismatch repair protein MutS [Bacteroidales bacterium AH-315-N07]